MEIWLFAHLDVAGGVTYSSDQVLASFRLRDTGTDLMQVSIYPSTQISVIPPQNYCLNGRVVHIWHRYTAYTIISEVDEQRSLKQSVNVVLCREQDHNIICLNNNIVLIDVHKYHNWRTLMFDWCSAGCLDMGRLWDGAAWCHFVSIRSSIHDNQW